MQSKRRNEIRRQLTSLRFKLQNPITSFEHSSPFPGCVCPHSRRSIVNLPSWDKCFHCGCYSSYIWLLVPKQGKTFYHISFSNKVLGKNSTCRSTVRERTTEHSCECHLHWARAVNCKCANKERWAHNWCLLWGFINLVDRISGSPCVQTILLCSRPFVQLGHGTAQF